MESKSVHIPKTKLGADLQEVARIKHEMTKLLTELEERATGRPVSKPGSWRHRPGSST